MRNKQALAMPEQPLCYRTINERGLLGDPGPRSRLSPPLGCVEIGSRSEGSVENGAEISVEGVKSEDEGMGLGEINCIEPAGNQDRDAEGAGEACGARGKDGAVMEEDAIRRGEPALERVVGLPG